IEVRAAAWARGRGSAGASPAPAPAPAFEPVLADAATGENAGPVVCPVVHDPPAVVAALARLALVAGVVDREGHVLVERVVVRLGVSGAGEAAALSVRVVVIHHCGERAHGAVEREPVAGGARAVVHPLDLAGSVSAVAGRRTRLEPERREVVILVLGLRVRRRWLGLVGSASG